MWGSPKPVWGQASFRRVDLVTLGLHAGAEHRIVINHHNSGSGRVETGVLAPAPTPRSGKLLAATGMPASMPLGGHVIPSAIDCLTAARATTPRNWKLGSTPARVRSG